MSYIPPQNKKEYWDIVDKHWKDLRLIFDTYLPTFGKKYIDGTVLDKTLGEYIEELKDTRNPRIARICNAAYFNIPDEKPTNEIESYAQFLDLCVLEKRLYGEERETQ